MTNPTIEQKKAFVREKIIEANKSILDLKIGCEVRYRCNGEVEYWYNGATIKAKDEYAKDVVKMRDYHREWKNIVLYSGLGKSERLDSELALGRPEKYNDKWAIIERYGDGTMYVRYLDFEIIGRPITLADIFYALDQILTEDKIKEVMQLTEYNAMTLIATIVQLWDCEYDNFDRQSEEVWLFLYRLLV